MATTTGKINEKANDTKVGYLQLLSHEWNESKNAAVRLLEIVTSTSEINTTNLTQLKNDILSINKYIFDKNIIYDKNELTDDYNQLQQDSNETDEKKQRNHILYA